MLPGKLCIGILEEDNPLKSYFRLKPLLVEHDGRYEEFGEADEYPEDGCLRIVPDKNESSHFKARMRRMGGFCVLDLREHALENDKIRPNKNYHSDETERNAHIVYSDVVREPAEDMIFEIIDANAGEPWPRPGVEKFVLPTLEICTAAEGEIRCSGAFLPEEEIQRFDFNLTADKSLRFIIRLPGTLDSVTGIAAKRVEAAQHPVSEAPSAQPAAVMPAEEKPWINREPTEQPDAPTALPSADGLTGLNPRRSRNLQEIIEEKWRHSRVDQLGHPVPVNAMGKPIQDPVEAAVSAIGGAWENPELHPRLIAAIADMEAFSTALEGRRKAVMNSEIRRELEDLEAERLRTLNELDRLRREKTALRESFKQEIRQEEADALRECVEKTKTAQAEYQKLKSQADDARHTVEKLDDVYASLIDGRLEEKLQDFAVTSRAAKLFAEKSQQPAPKQPVSCEAVSAEAWIERMQRSFTAEGLAIDRADAANLLVCAALDNVLFLSGTASGGKSAAARAIAGALGLGERGVILRGFNRRPEAFAEFEADKFYLCELADSGSGYPVCAEALQQGIMIRLEPPKEDAPWHVQRNEAAQYPVTCPDVLKNAFLRETDTLPAVIEHRMKNLRAALAAHRVYLSAGVLERTWNYCAAMIENGFMTPESALDHAFAQCALPCVLAEAPAKCLFEIREMITGMDKCSALLDSRAPVMIG